jgi:hypothetical protein
VPAFGGGHGPAVARRIATWNDNPLDETADEILSSLADYLAKIGAGDGVNEQG